MTDHERDRARNPQRAGGPLRAARRFWRAVRTVGLSQAVALSRGGRAVACRTRLAEHPLLVRPGSSDLSVFRQIFVQQEYSPLRSQTGVDVVVDLGANVGYSAAWFLTAFPACRLIAVEPDPDNFAMLQRNMAPFGTRVTCLNAGIWSHTCHVRLSTTPYRDGLEWSRQVVECDAADPGAMRGLGFADLLDQHGIGRVSLLKCDIEGAEVVLFGESCSAWIDRVDSIAIELHDDSMFGNGIEAFHRALQGDRKSVV